MVFYSIYKSSKHEKNLVSITSWDKSKLKNLQNIKGSSLQSYLLGDDKSLKFLKEWTRPFIPQLNLPAKSFASFLPESESPTPLTPGHTWQLLPVTSGKSSEHLANNRYHPPDLGHHKEILLFKILQMFHKSPFLYTRFPPQGMALVLRALNDEYYDILFRIHAEFQINEVCKPVARIREMSVCF